MSYFRATSASLKLAIDTACSFTGPSCSWRPRPWRRRSCSNGKIKIGIQPIWSQLLLISSATSCMARAATSHNPDAAVAR